MFLGLDDGMGSFMKKLLDPPRQESLDAAALSLEKLGAMKRHSDTSRGCMVTPLGMHLAAIPSPPIVGKRTLPVLLPLLLLLWPETEDIRF
jgi:HrpA-like RNA helicase